MPIIRRKDERKGFTILGKFGGGQPQPIDYSKEYFFIEDISGEENVLTISKNSSTEYVNVSVSSDKVNWVDLGSTESGDLTYTIPANGKLYVKGVNKRWATSTINSKWNSINCSKSFNVCGNIMSLLYGDDFIDKINLPKDFTFSHLFNKAENLVDVSNLVLPATTLVNYCYHNMFAYCSSLTESPILYATILKELSYAYMFYKCEKLTKIVTYAEDITSRGCIIGWVNYTSPTGDFYNLGGAEYPSGASGIPTGWTEHTSL